MKEDKLDKEIAASLKEKLVEASVPYELGAWEGFQKKRALRKRKATANWASGIAASILLMAVGLISVDFSETEDTNSTEIQLAESTEKASENGFGEFLEIEAEVVDSLAENIIDQQSSSASSADKTVAEVAGDPSTQANSGLTNVLATVPEREGKSEKTEKTKVSSDKRTSSTEKSGELAKENAITQLPPLIAKTKEVENKTVEKSPEEKLALAQVEEPGEPAEKQKFIAESDFPVIPKDKTTVGLGMGVSPGFGAVQSDNQVATAQTIGVGMLVDIKLPGKFTLGSGLSLNYLNQTSEQESTIVAFGNSYPLTENLQVRQMQVEVPVFVKYPLTRNNSISVQAGFSNFYALNESGSQENSYDRQVASYSYNSNGFSSVSLSNKSMNSVTSLKPTESKFYPFATLNFGLNLRVLETEGANYVIMPFYNYQLKQVSGYGDTYGLFGASFKMNFGGSGK